MKMEPIFTSGNVYFVSQRRAPSPCELPCGEEKFDALIVVLDPQSLTGRLAKTISSEIVRMNNDWVETLGDKSEYLHDMVDRASVEAGRQTKVGDGSPMTAWHENLTDISAMVEYVAGGGHGACENKLIVVIGSESGTLTFVKRLREICQQQLD